MVNDRLHHTENNDCQRSEYLRETNKNHVQINLFFLGKINLKRGFGVYTMPPGHDGKQCSLDFVRAVPECRLVDKCRLERRRQQVSRATLWSACQWSTPVCVRSRWLPRPTLPTSRWVKHTRAPSWASGKFSPPILFQTACSLEAGPAHDFVWIVEISVLIIILTSKV